MENYETNYCNGLFRQIGSELVYRLRQEKGNDNVLATDIRRPKGHPVVENGLFETLDVLDEEECLN